MKVFVEKSIRCIGTLCVLCLFLISCGGGDDDVPSSPDPTPVTAELTIDANVLSNGLIFSAESGEQSISFTCNMNWSLSITNGSWCTPSLTNGSKGTSTVKFSVTENTSYDERKASVVIKVGTISKTFIITQKSANALILTKNEYEISQEGTTIEVEIKSNVDYEIQMPDVDWITEVASGRGLSSDKLQFKVSPNESYESRSAEIIFYDKNSNLKDVVKITQSQKDAIVVSQNEYEVPFSGTTIKVAINSNVDYVMEIGCDWIKQVETSSSRALKSDDLYFEVQKNLIKESRSAEIVFEDPKKTVKVIITVTQAPFKEDDSDNPNGKVDDMTWG
ncbi:MAG: BACON domain-containing protein [Bacteroidaceae bacterium]|nr:BACON domain-containing protein [Bacteroidaceae bacterium]